MSLLSDKQIIDLISKGHILHTPSSRKYTEEGMSTGVSSYGYDACLGNDLQIITSAKTGIIDPLNPEIIVTNLHAEKHEQFILPAHSFALSHTVEVFNIPRDVTAICMGKSTYARCGIFVNVTPLESEWTGQVTLEIYNSTPCGVILRPEVGICQFLFLRGEEPCAVSYKDKRGKYQHQLGITHSRSAIK